MENFDKNYEALWEVNRTKELENFDKNCNGQSEANNSDSRDNWQTLIFLQSI